VPVVEQRVRRARFEPRLPVADMWTFLFLCCSSMYVLQGVSDGARRGRGGSYGYLRVLRALSSRERAVGGPMAAALAGQPY
jgi:hypothetical protein